MNGYITAKQRWVADRQFKAGQTLKYRRTIGGLSKDYVLVAKYTDAIPEMWPAWFDNVYPNTWFLPSNLVDDTQIWPGDTIVDFSTGKIYYNSSENVKYAGELELPTTVDTALNALVITPFTTIKAVKLTPVYNADYDEMKHTGFFDKSNAQIENWYLYKVEGTQVFNVSVTATYPLIFSTSATQHSITIHFLDYTSVSYLGIAPDATTATTCTYKFNNAIANHVITITNSGGNITINRSNA